MNNVLTFHMIRHGPVSNPEMIWYGRDIPFDLQSAHIVAHFNQLAKTLPTDPDNSVWFASEYPRASTLAQFLLKASDVPTPPQLVVSRDFIEQQYGEMEGAKGRQAIKDPRFSSYFAHMWDNAPPGGESLKMLQHRAGCKLDELANNLPIEIENIVIVAHGGFNMAAYAHAKGLRLIDVFQSKKQRETPSFSYMSHLKLGFDREKSVWVDASEYVTGLPKIHPKLTFS